MRSFHIFVGDDSVLLKQTMPNIPKITATDIGDHGITAIGCTAYSDFYCGGALTSASRRGLKTVNMLIDTLNTVPYTYKPLDS